MNLPQLLDYLGNKKDFLQNITTWKTIPAQEAQTVSFPESIPPKIIEVLKQDGISSLYTHQASAFKQIQAGNNVVIVTPTASGKTLTYNLPILTSLLKNPEIRTLYLFPTKALAQDQVHELHHLVEKLGEPIICHTFDGDTPREVRRTIRSAGHIVVTNPDMLHQGILPHHTLWIKLFENLKFIVIDEIHAYRGVFGSHIANVIRRLKRICNFYGSDPQIMETCTPILFSGNDRRADIFL